MQNAAAICCCQINSMNRVDCLHLSSLYTALCTRPPHIVWSAFSVEWEKSILLILFRHFSHVFSWLLPYIFNLRVVCADVLNDTYFVHANICKWVELYTPTFSISLVVDFVFVVWNGRLRLCSVCDFYGMLIWAFGECGWTVRANAMQILYTIKGGRRTWRRELHSNH